MKILYVDTLKAIHAQSNVKGLMNAFMKLGQVFPFDYRTLVKISSPASVNKTYFPFEEVLVKKDFWSLAQWYLSSH